jgi:hypothetical protein
MSRDSPLSERDAAYLGPVYIAVLIDEGWLDDWPLTMTPRGRHLLRKNDWPQHIQQHIPTSIPAKAPTARRPDFQR